LPTHARLDASQLSAKQKAECREDFARFFPDVPDAELDRQKIMIKDVTRVANLLKEKIKAEEVSFLILYQRPLTTELPFRLLQCWRRSLLHQINP
jgi:hypothetical protein